jgi:medium-chain acyl-[acyl-carrier-protein] hydrolase
MHMDAVGGLIGEAMTLRSDGAVRSWTRTGAGALVRLRRDEARTRLRLYCLPYAGGSAGVFRSWCDQLPADVDVWGVEDPGHGSRISEPLMDRIDALAALIADAVAAEPAVPFALFGHSMGSLVAFEVCHALAARGATMPTLLVAAGHRGPQLPASGPPVHDTPDAEFVAHLRELGATPPEVLESAELTGLMLPILRNDFRACEMYGAPERPPLRTAIVVYGGLADEDADRDALLAWRHATRSWFALRLFPGGHFFVRECAGRVAATLQRDMAEALSLSGANGAGRRDD